MPDTPETPAIPDEAVEAAAKAMWRADHRPRPWEGEPAPANSVAPDRPATERARQGYRVVAHRALSAAHPLLSRDETAEPELVWGNRPDGSPWVISAEFYGPDVRVDGHGVLRLHGKAVAPTVAHRTATALLAAIAWLENDGAAKAEHATFARVAMKWGPLTEVLSESTPGGES